SCSASTRQIRSPLPPAANGKMIFVNGPDCATARVLTKARLAATKLRRSIDRPPVPSFNQLDYKPQMPEPNTGKITIEAGATRVSALLQVPPRASACFVFAHGAGAGMTHPFMSAVAVGLTERRIATLRYQFPYMEKRSKRPDP